MGSVGKLKAIDTTGAEGKLGFYSPMNKLK
jgi:hypothetical protein